MRYAALAVIFIATTTGALAQDAPALSSPDVQTDRSVVFRFWAPAARDVQLTGSWMGPKPPMRMTKDAAGVWSVTAGPLEPNIYEYAFLVDGTRTLDPVCRCGLMWAGRFASSHFVIPGAPAHSWELQQQPSGVLHHDR